MLLTASITGADTSMIKFMIYDQDGNLKAEIKDSAIASPAANIYQAYFTGLERNDMRTPFTIKALKNGVETGKSCVWSLEGYVREARLSSSISAEELNLFNAMLKYVDSANAAFGS